ncbi:MAG: hypothetical protein ABIQ74_13885 [Chitinophagales bacterium]
MKNHKLSITLLTLAMFFSFSIYAQQQQQEPQKPAQPSVKNDNGAATPKEVWKKNYQEIKPRLDSYLEKVKELGSKHPDFTEEVTKLDRLVKDFKIKIDKWDAATKEERERYNASMKQFFERIKGEENRIKEMWNNISDGERSPSKSTEQHK